MDLRSENSGNGRGGREKSGNGWQGAEEESMSTFTQVSHHEGLDKKGCSTRLELVQHHKVYSLEEYVF